MKLIKGPLFFSLRPSQENAYGLPLGSGPYLKNYWSGAMASPSGWGHWGSKQGNDLSKNAWIVVLGAWTYILLIWLQFQGPFCFYILDLHAEWKYLHEEEEFLTSLKLVYSNHLTHKEPMGLARVGITQCNRWGNRHEGPVRGGVSTRFHVSVREDFSGHVDCGHRQVEGIFWQNMKHRILLLTVIHRLKSCGKH